MSAETGKVTDQARYGSTWEADVTRYKDIHATQNYLNRVLKIESQKKVKACKQSALVKTAHTLTLGCLGALRSHE